jgi:hypothetical protein
MTRIAVTIVFDMDTAAAATLPADPGWVGTDGDHEPPTTGVELWGHRVAQHAIRAAIGTTPAGVPVFLNNVRVAVHDDDC